jgi:hypothetical protein
MEKMESPAGASARAARNTLGSLPNAAAPALAADNPRNPRRVILRTGYAQAKQACSVSPLIDSTIKKALRFDEDSMALWRHARTMVRPHSAIVFSATAFQALVGAAGST